MTPRTAFLYTDDFVLYKLGDRHPLQQTRLQMVHRLLGSYGMFSPEGPVDWITPVPATEGEILLVHTPDYVEAVQRAGSGDRSHSLTAYGLEHGGDTPAFKGMYESAALYAGGTVDAARLVLSGKYDTAFNVAGGLHHAMPARASGFCTFNDLALGIRELLLSLDRVAYIDIDVHHGDGVQTIFYDDPRVLTVSLHESGRHLFPGTGFPGEIGEGAAAGTSLNVPLYPYTTDAVWHEAFDAVVPEALERFRPGALVLQLGADAHWEDPLAHLMLTSHGWMAAVDKLLTLGTGKPVVVTGGGGYNIRTVARLWAMVQARCAGVVLSDAVPTAYDALYNLPRLHDAAEPDIEPAPCAASWAYMRQQVAQLRETLASI